MLTRSQAKKYFGDGQPWDSISGLAMTLYLYTVTGVMEDVPENSHFEFDMLISFVTHPRANDDFWLSNSFATYVLLEARNFLQIGGR